MQMVVSEEKTFGRKEEKERKHVAWQPGGSEYVCWPGLM